ncbi:MAG: adaptor protein MecA [Clostridiales bacterium]|nr:adaptor protein MecA [Clostridiales bacterium]
MKIERINENQIRCTLTSFDLSSRNINLIELAYGTEKARKLFREMIQRASSEVGFEAEDIPLMVEAIPLSGESIMLVITKIEDPEELDTRFSKFSPFSEEGESLLSQLASELLEGAGEGLEGMLEEELPFLEPDTVKEAKKQAEAAGQSRPVSSIRIFRFEQLDRVFEAAQAAGHICGAVNTLYKKPGTRQYYLVLKREGCTDLEFSRICNILAEYAVKLNGEAAGEAYFQEHYEVIIKEQALQNLLKIA